MISTLKQDNKTKINIIGILAIVLYIVSAIAFECTPETARIATLGIYFVFAVGVIYILLINKVIVNIYDASLLLMVLCVIIMNLPMGLSENSLDTMYWVLTCSALCFIVKFMVCKNNGVVKWILFASIIGSIILVVRIINAYGGIGQMLNYATSGGEKRVGELANENTIGIFMANAVLCCFSFIFYSKGLFKKIALSILMVVFITMLLLTGSKKAIIFIVVGSLIYLFCFTRKQNVSKKIFIVMLILILVLAIIYAVSNLAAFGTIKSRLEQLVEFLTGEGEASQTDQNRINMISGGMSAFLESPIFGNGTGYSYVLFGTYSHNNFVEILMNYGIVGFSIYYLHYLFLIPKLWKMAKNKDIYAIYFLTYIILQILLSIGWVNYYDRMAQLVTAAAWGYVSINSTKGEQNETNQHI